MTELTERSQGRGGLADQPSPDPRRSVSRMAIAACVAASITAHAAALPSQDGGWQSQVDGVFARWNRPDSPGCALGVFDATFQVSADKDRLLLRRDADTESAPLQPAGADTFRFQGMTLRFTRDSSTRIDALVVDAGWVRDIRFVRP